MEFSGTQTIAAPIEDLLSVVEQPVSLEALVHGNEEAVYAPADNFEDSTTPTPVVRWLVKTGRLTEYII